MVFTLASIFVWLTRRVNHTMLWPGIIYSWICHGEQYACHLVKILSSSLRSAKLRKFPSF